MGREQWVKEAIDRGATHASLAAEAGVSVYTIRRWLRDLGMRTKAASARVTVQQLHGDALLRECPRHGLTTFRPRPGGGLSLSSLPL